MTETIILLLVAFAVAVAIAGLLCHVSRNLFWIAVVALLLLL